jgi:hypothetical protein
MSWGGTLLVDANAGGAWRDDQAALAQARDVFTA